MPESGEANSAERGNPMAKYKAFSLVELLTVVAITALLASVIVPALSKAKDSAKTTVCTSRLQQLGLIFKMYADENDGFMQRGSGYSDGAVSWFQCIKSYYDDDELIICPLATKTFKEGGRNPHMAWWNITDAGNYFEGSYGVNLWIAKRPCDSRNWGTPYARGVSQAPLLTCNQWKDMEPYSIDEPLDYETKIWTPGPYNEMRRACVKRHAPYNINVLFLDFSVEKRTIKEIWRLKWHRNWPADAPLPLWPDWMEDVPEPD